MRSPRSTVVLLVLLAAAALLSPGCGPSIRADAPVVIYYYIPG